jgi:hypothetical protein
MTKWQSVQITTLILSALLKASVTEAQNKQKVRYTHTLVFVLVRIYISFIIQVKICSDF